jgi:uracil-DNA glycosylase
MSTEYYCPFELEPGWKNALHNEFTKPYIPSLAAFVERERASNIPVYPPKDLVFNALRTTPFAKTRVVIVGQDPYHGAGQAHGLSFSVPKGIPLPPSLQNIFKELGTDLGVQMPSHGCLLSWAEQGVLLLNATLTVKQGNPMSHHGKGWEQFTDAIVLSLANRTDPVIFVLWGKSAQEKVKHIYQNLPSSAHTILTAPHPSPFSVHTGFFGCRHFSQINEILMKRGEGPINWNL